MVCEELVAVERYGLSKRKAIMMRSEQCLLQLIHYWIKEDTVPSVWRIEWNCWPNFRQEPFTYDFFSVGFLVSAFACVLRLDGVEMLQECRRSSSSYNLQRSNQTQNDVRQNHPKVTYLRGSWKVRVMFCFLNSVNPTTIIPF